MIEGYADVNLRYDPAGPKIGEFHRSDERRRLIFGPVGSGKSVAGCWEVLRRGFEMPPCIDGIRRSRYAIVRNCYDDQTEILTEKRSWQPFKELRPDDKVAQLNGDAMEFVLPSYWHAAPYEGEMFGFEGEAVDYLVTPDHKMHVSKIETRKRKWSDYRFETAERVHDAYGFRVRRDAEWIGDDPGMTKDMFEFLGFFFAEGSTSSFIDSQGTHRRILQVTQCKPLGIVYCRDLLKRAGVDHYENARQDTGINFRVKTGAGYVGSDLFDLLSPLGKCTELSIPECILSATKAHLQAFLHGFTMGDGTVTASGVTVLYTSSEALAGNLQEVVVKAGKVATVHLRRDMVVGAPVTIKGVKTAATAKAWTVAVSSPAKNRPRLQRKTGDGTRYKGFYREQYNGHVYCLTVPSHVVYVRRNGKAFWCGQTFSDLERTTIKTWEAQFLHAFGKPVSRRAGIVHEIHRNVGDGTKVQIEVMFFSMDRPDDVKRLLSYEISGAFVNEAREIPKAIFEALDDRVTRYPAKEMLPPGVIPFFGWWADTNPPDRDHWIYETFENEKPPGWVMFRQPGGLVHDGYEWKENPKAENLLNLTLGARYYTEAMSGKSEDHIRVYYGAEYGYVKEGRLVIGDFNETWNSSDVTLKFDPNIETIYVGIDFGATPAAAFLQLGTNGQWKCIEEMQSEKTGTGPFAADRLKPRLLELESLGHKIIMTGDPAGSGTSETDGRTPFKMLADNNILCNPAFSNAFNLRMEILRGLCRSATEGQPKFLLSHACKIARRGLAQKFVFKRVGVQTEEGQKYQVLPDKNEFSHIIDAIIYGIMGSGEGKQIGQSHVKGGKLAYKKIN